MRSEVTIIVGKKPLSHYQGYMFIKSAMEKPDKVIVLSRHPNLDKAIVLADWITKIFGFKVDQTEIIPSEQNPRVPVTVKIILRRT